MQTNPNINLTMLCDFYELTMANGYFKSGMQDKITYFDLFFRKVPDEGGFAIAAGLEQAIEYIQNLHFGEDDIAYLRTRGIFGEDFLDYLKSFRFTGDIWAVPEGTPIFPKEPILTVRAPAIEAQLVETFLLLTLNHQSLIATKANRVCRAAKGRVVLEFGSRRAQGSDAAIWARERHTLEAARARPARSPTSSTAFLRAARWRIRGSRCSRASMRRSRPTVKSTPITRRFWSTRITRCKAAFLMQSAHSTRS